MSGKLKAAVSSVRDKKEVLPGKQVELEKGDFRALCSAAYSVFGPVALGAIAFFAIVIVLFLLIWG